MSLTNWFLSISRPSQPVRSTKSALAKNKRRPLFEVLEDRNAPSATEMGIPTWLPPPTNAGQADSDQVALVTVTNTNDAATSDGGFGRGQSSGSGSGSASIIGVGSGSGSGSASVPANSTS